VSRRRQTELVGGYDVFKALSHGQGRVSKGVKTTEKESRSASPVGAGEKRNPTGATRIGRTTQPPRHKLTCFECGYKFEMAGKTDSIGCPKCRVDILLRDVTIDEQWDQDIKTGGTIEIKRGGVIKRGELVAKVIIMDGRIENGVLNAYQDFILKPNGEYNESRIETPNLIIEPHAKIVLKKESRFESVNVGGSLHAKKLCVDTMISVKAGGLLSGGPVTAEHFQLEAGGGLKASMNISKAEGSVER